MEVLSQLIDDEVGNYRVRAKNRVHYVKMAVGVFDEDTMCRPYLLIPQLPDFPDSEWISMTVTRKTDHSLTYDLSFNALPSVKTIWHPTFIDVLTLSSLK